MSEERIRTLEEHVGNLRVENASLAASVQHLTESVDRLTVSLTGLEATMNRGKGALWVVVGASSVAGAILASMISNLFGKGS